MGIKSDIWIRKMALEQDLIVPFVDRQVRATSASPQVYKTHSEIKSSTPVISYGLSSYGYDIRIAPHFKIFTNARNALIDPKNFDESAFVTHSGDHCIIPPNSFILGYSIEKFKIPRDILVICLTKSSYARCGLIVNVTPLEPSWAGFVTLEISNTTPLPAKVYANEGIAQVLFFQGDGPCETSYADRQGKYQNQPAEVVLPKL
jgi:dCTP deaminase